MTTRLDIARHEIGHALVAAALGIELHTIELAPAAAPQFLGSIELRTTGDPLDLAAVAYGGALAQVPDRVPADACRAFWTGCNYADDREQLQRWIGRATGFGPIPCTTTWLRATRAFELHRPLVDPLAALLADAGQLDPRVVAECVGRWSQRVTDRSRDGNRVRGELTA